MPEYNALSGLSANLWVLINRLINSYRRETRASGKLCTLMSSETQRKPDPFQKGMEISIKELR